MNAVVIGLLAFAGIFGATLVGMRLRSALPDHHLSAETKDTVRVGMGLVATMTALLLGLLVASAKGSYDNQRTQVILMAAKVSFLDRVLVMYGPETAETRTLLRESNEGLIQKLWPDRSSQAAQDDPAVSTGQALLSSIHKLTPQNDEQRALKSAALDTVSDLGKTRWLLFAQGDTSIPKPLLIMVVVWLAIISLSFGLFAPTNKTVVVTMIVVSLLVSSALFLILELDRPFDGVIQISSTPMHNAVSNLGR
jgi:Protein of unknown function (DUF4239)